VSVFSRNHCPLRQCRRFQVHSARNVRFQQELVSGFIKNMPMSDEEKKKYIEEVFKYCKIDSILVINKSGSLERLQCPFEVLIISNVGELQKGLICLVNAVKLDLTLIDVYNIRNKAYYFFNFRVLEHK
jgi:hypothetical protein